LIRDAVGRITPAVLVWGYGADRGIAFRGRGAPRDAESATLGQTRWTGSSGLAERGRAGHARAHQSYSWSCRAGDRSSASPARRCLVQHMMRKAEAEAAIINANSGSRRAVAKMGMLLIPCWRFVVSWDCGGAEQVLRRVNCCRRGRSRRLLYDLDGHGRKTTYGEPIQITLKVEPARAGG